MILEGKIINFLGDSITEGNGVSNISENRFDNIIHRLCGTKAVNNYGVGGTRIAHQFKPSDKPKYDLNFCARAYFMDKNADIIVVFGGTNDFGHGDAPFGNLSDKTPESFCGAVDFLINLLKEEYPRATICFLTPARRLLDTIPSSNPIKASDAKELIEYVDAIILKCNQYEIPVLNMYKELGINPNNPCDMQEFTTDGLHFNDKAHTVIAQKIVGFLERITA